MTLKTANRRYIGLFIPSMLAYAAAFIGVAYVTRTNDFSKGTEILLGLLPVIPVLLACYAFVRFLTEVDEFMRSQLAKHLLIGLGVGVLLTFSYGLVAEIAELPALPIYWVLPISMALMGGSQLISHLRHDDGCC